MASTLRYYTKNASRRTPSPLSTRRATVACNACPRDVCLSTIWRDRQAATKKEAHNMPSLRRNVRNASRRSLSPFLTKRATHETEDWARDACTSAGLEETCASITTTEATIHGTVMSVAPVQNTAVLSPSTASIHGVTTAPVSMRQSCSESTSSSRRSRELSAREKLAVAELKLARIQLELAECESEDSTDEDLEENDYNGFASLQKIREPYEAQRCQIRLPVEKITNGCSSLRFKTYETLDQRCDVYQPEERIINDCTSLQEIQRCPQILSEDLTVVSKESCRASSLVTSRAHSPTDFKQEDRPRSEFTTSGVKTKKCEVMTRGTNYASRKDTQHRKSCEEIKQREKLIKETCPLCHGGHALVNCCIFHTKPIEEKWAIAKKYGVCFKCLWGRHKRATCRRSPPCSICRKWHHTMLHDKSISTPSTKKQRTSTNEDSIEVPCTRRDKARKVYSKMIRVEVYGTKGSKKIMALFDEHSTVSLINADIAREIGASGSVEELHIETLSGQRIKEAHSQIVNLQIKGVHLNNIENMGEVRTVENLKFAPQFFDKEKIKIYSHLSDLSDILFYEAEPPQLIIGQDNWELILTREFRKGKPGQPVASKSSLGWVLHGVDIDSAKSVHYLSTCVQDNFNEVYKIANSENGKRINVARTPTPSHTSLKKKRFTRRSKSNGIENKSTCYGKRNDIASEKEQSSPPRKSPNLNDGAKRCPDILLKKKYIEPRQIIKSRRKAKVAKGDTWQAAKLCGHKNHSDDMTRSKRISQHGTVSRVDIAKRVKSKSYRPKNNVWKIATRPPMKNDNNYKAYSVRKIEEHKLEDESNVKNISTGQTAVRPELIINSFDNVMNRYINGSKNTDWTIM